MSLIKCSECGREISDKATACPHCGAPVEIESDEPVKEDNSEEEYTSKTEKTPDDSVVTETNNIMENTDKPKKKSKRILIIVIVAVLAVVGALGIYMYQKQKAQEEYDLAVTLMRSETGLMEVYVNTIVNTDDIDSIEDLVNLTNSVWHDAIWEESNSNTKKYVSGANDFNEAIDNLYSDPKVEKFISSIKEVIPDADYLNNVPEELSDVKSKYDDVVATYKTLVDYAEWPTGSYNTYMEQAQEKYNAFNEAYSKFDSSCPALPENKDKDTKEDSEE